MDFEIEIIEFLQSCRTQFLDVFLQAFTQFGSVLGFVAFFFFLLKFDKKLCLTFILTYGYEFFFVQMVKILVARVRPYDAVSSIVCIGGYESDFSFPSGHTALAMTIAIFMIYFLWKQYKSGRARVNIVIISMLFVVLVGVSRMYLGVHYLTDVLYGALFGLVFSFIGLFEMCFLEELKLEEESDNESKNRKT